MNTFFVILNCVAIIWLWYITLCVFSLYKIMRESNEHDFEFKQNLMKSIDTHRKHIQQIDDFLSRAYNVKTRSSNN